MVGSYCEVMSDVDSAKHGSPGTTVVCSYLVYDEEI